MSNYTSIYLRPDNTELEVTNIDNRGNRNNHPGGPKEYDKDYYYVNMGSGPMSMTEFRKYIKKNKLMRL